MTLTTSILTGRLPFPDDSVPANAYLRFTLSGVDTEGPDILHPASRTIALVSGAIPAGFDLWQNMAGLRNTVYKVELVVIVSDNFGAMTQERVYQIGTIQIGSAATYDLADLLVAPTSGLDIDAYIAQILTAAAEVELGLGGAYADAAEASAVAAAASATAAATSAGAAAGSASAAAGASGTATTAATAAAGSATAAAGSATAAAQSLSLIHI